MRRRSLLASVATSSVAATAGCLDRLPGVGDSEDGCGDVDVFGTVTIRDMPDAGRGMHVRAYATSEACTGELTLEAVADGRVYTDVEESSDGGEWRFDVRTGDQLPDGDTMTLRVRDDNDVVVGRDEVAIGRE